MKAKVDTGRKTGLFPLLRIRNPWGNDTEWRGAWSDGSREWQFIPEDEKDNIGLTFDVDGEFYMSQKDFLRQFDTLEICNLSPDTMDEDEEYSAQVRAYKDITWLCEKEKKLKNKEPKRKYVLARKRKERAKKK